MNGTGRISLAAVLRGVAEELRARESRIAALRESIAAGSYRVSAATLADAVAGSGQG